MMPKHFLVQFDRVTHGWLPVTISDGNQRLTFTASNIRYDSVTNLVEVLVSVLSDQEPAIVKWFTEPLEYTFVFTPCKDPIFSVRKWWDEKRFKGPPPYILFQGDQFELVQTFWRALRNLENQNDFNYQWHHPFPTPQMRLLEKLLHHGDN